MDDDIPNIDLRVRRFFNDLNALEDSARMSAKARRLNEFHLATQLHKPKWSNLPLEKVELFEKGMEMACDPMYAFVNDTTSSNNESSQTLEQQDSEGLSLSKPEFNMLLLERGRRKPAQTTDRHWVPQLWTNPIAAWQKLPPKLWQLVILCAMGASVQGWDEAAVNGAQLWYTAAFQKYIVVPSELKETIAPSPAIVGLINGAPYLCCILSCGLTPLLNHYLGRRGTIFVCAVFSAVFALLQGFAQSWQQMFAFRFLMGVGIGPKSVTIPIYASECAPANIRGSLVMFWQAWTAFGIMAGCLSGLALQGTGSATNNLICPTDKLLSWQCSKNWRLIIASPAILPAVLAAYIYCCPESPRWCMAKGHYYRKQSEPERASLHYKKAWKGLMKVSRAPVFAARDMVWQYFLLDEENNDFHRRRDSAPGQSWFRFYHSELFSRRRNTRAIFASLTCMFAQQFCGVNLIVYYSNIVFLMIHFNTRDQISGQIQSASSADLLQVNRQALSYTAGFGVINFLFAIPAFFTIDTVGRRSLLLCTFPFMAIAHFITMAAFVVESDVGIRLALFGMYFFGVAYSVAEGPVPFVYASESMPLYMRELGMGIVVSINWMFNWLIAFTGPWFFNAFSAWGTFLWYGIWCIILWFMIFCFVPETRMLSLEELDVVFDSVTFKEFNSHAWQKLRWHLHLTQDKPARLYE